MNAKEFVDSLFEGYEQTAALADFKEELLANLNAKIESFIKKGMDTDAAFTKASTELGDVSALADDLSLKKRKEVFEEVYMDIRTYMRPSRVVGYCIFGSLALFGALAALIAFFSVGNDSLNLKMTTLFGTLLPFLTTAAAGFTFLCTTQETAAMYPVSNKRALWYTAAGAFIVFGLFAMPLAYFGTKIGFESVSFLMEHADPSDIAIFTAIGDTPIEAVIPIVAFLGPAIPFVLPGVSVLAYMILTEKDRLKPWVNASRAGRTSRAATV